MVFRKLRNENGITLIELIAAIGLLTIFITISSTLLAQGFHSEDKTSNEITLSQNVNVMLSELHSQYNKGKSTLCFNTFDKDFTIRDYIIHNGDQQLTIIDGCIHPTNQEPLSVTLTAIDNAGNDISLRTIWGNKKNYEIMVTDYNEEIINEDNENCTVRGTCTFDGNTRIEVDGTIDRDSIIEIKNGDAIFTNEINVGQDVNFVIRSENVTFKKGLVLDHKASLTMQVNGDSTFDGNIILIQNNHQITIYGDAVFNGNITFGQNNSTIIVKGNAMFNGSINFEGNNANIIIKGNGTCKNNDLGRNITINANKNCS
ncbi:hypothetical protein CFK37_12815 [Virgibacillus phasianinus]|uniref:Uncharacterized protein n=1 Tax=Virgibacillus phasianinus TaxID=2017483 RepID=A0A220U4D7_9BACI|nr:hypothetical protein [Virgibacillus phasianinus]ASK62960.1 hypothetical protein CFK37_12815 [Virgibacillus phasianinus]